MLTTVNAVIFTELVGSIEKRDFYLALVSQLQAASDALTSK